MHAAWMGWIVAGVTLAGSGAGRAPEARTLARGASSGITQAREVVARTPQEFTRLWTAHAAKRQPPPEPPRVDFRREMVLAVFMGEQRTGGYAIEITGVRSEGGRVVATVRRSTPPPGAITTQALTQPFHIVAVPQSDRPVRFVPADGR